MGAHLIDGEFQSDKYPTTPRGKVPLSCRDTDAQDLLWIYAQRHRHVDREFSEDLELALQKAGYAPEEFDEALVLDAEDDLVSWLALRAAERGAIAALAACTHPDENVQRTRLGASPGSERMDRCALCGAVRYPSQGLESGEGWTRPELVAHVVGRSRHG